MSRSNIYPGQNISVKYFGQISRSSISVKNWQMSVKISRSSISVKYLDQLSRSNIGQMSVKYRSNIGQISVRNRSNFGQISRSNILVKCLGHTSRSFLYISVTCLGQVSRSKFLVKYLDQFARLYHL